MRERIKSALSFLHKEKITNRGKVKIMTIISSFPGKEKILTVFSSIPTKENVRKNLSSILDKGKVRKAFSSIPREGKIITALSSVPLIAATTMSGSCAAACPYGLVNDPYPGQCPRYTDLNGDGICDLSQTTAAAATDTSTSTDTSTTTDTQTTSNGNGNGGHADTTTPTDDNTTLVPDSGADSGNIPDDATNYYVLPLSIILIGGYLFTYYLFQKGVLNRNKHRRIWNLLVTAGYMGTGVTGVLLILMINLGIKTALNPSITFWHAELAILMVIGTLIHVHIYWKSFKNMFRVLFGGFKFDTNKTNQGKRRPLDAQGNKSPLKVSSIKKRILKPIKMYFLW